MSRFIFEVIWDKQIINIRYRVTGHQGNTIKSKPGCTLYAYWKYTVKCQMWYVQVEVMRNAGSALQWLTSYLSGRSQSVSINSVNSEKHNLWCGVPQGSVAGPLLFIMFTTPLQDIVSAHNISCMAYICWWHAAVFNVWCCGSLFCSSEDGKLFKGCWDLGSSEQAVFEWFKNWASSFSF